MRLILTIVVCFISATSFSQAEYYTDTKAFKDYERFVKEIKKNNDIFSHMPYIWEWKSKIQIDSLDFIDEKSPLYPKSDKKYSIFENDMTTFNFIRIDSID